MKPAQIKKKLALLEVPGTAQVLLDALIMYIGDVQGAEIPDNIALTAKSIIGELKKWYIIQLPTNQQIVKQRDLEDLIKEARKTKEQVDKQIEKWYRASGDCICTKCGKKYSKHPYSNDVLQYYPDFYLNVLCNGDFVKL